jgi:hypothetical protein
MMPRHIRTRRRPRREGGQAVAEFALIAPIFLLLIFGLIDTARLYQSWVTIQHAAREGARYGVTGRADCAAPTPSRPNCIEFVTRNQTNALTDNVADVTIGTRAWEYPAFASPPTEDTPGEQCDALEVWVDYEFTPSTPMIGNIFGPITITARERLVNEPFGPCN